jgi:hypothetical protein
MDDHSGSASRQLRSAPEAPASEPLLGDRAVTDDDGLGPPRSRRLTDQEKVVRAFLRDGRLVSIPARTGKRDLLLPVILDRCFPEDRAYEEKEVNMRLALLHPDVAALRRYLVEGGLMSREAGIYRRVRPPG